MTTWGGECWAWPGRLSDLGLTLLPTLGKLPRVEGASMLEETLTGSGAKSCYLPVGPGTRPVGLLESRVLWRAAVG